MTNYVVASTKSWNLDQFRTTTPQLPGDWYWISDRAELTLERLDELQPRYVFFPHWSWIVPQAIVEKFECVCLHMTDLPYGRGGSPLQNLIEKGHQKTKLTALRMTTEVDAGPVYRKIDLSLQGSARSIFEDMARKSYELIRFIVHEEPEPKAQSGEVTHFVRRTPEQSEFKGEITPAKLYDLIRMLDADTYPLAYSIVGDYRLEFKDASLDSDTVSATVTFHRTNQS